MTATVRDVMTWCPVSVPADASFQTVAAVLSHNRISAVPVTDRLGYVFDDGARPRLAGSVR